MAKDLDDLFIATLARELRDTDRLFVGVNQVDVALAAYLARRLWAPKLKIWAAGAAMIEHGQDLLMVGRRSYDNVVVATRGSSFHHARAFEDVREPVVFAGGLQVDGRGNANLAGIRDGQGGWRVRGPGSAGLASLTALSPRFYIAVPHHDSRALVQRCSAISVLGDPVERAALGLPADALAAVITPLATFAPTNEGLEVIAVSPGVSSQELAERTGFPIRESERIAEREPLTGAESTALNELRRAMQTNRRTHVSSRAEQA